MPFSNHQLSHPLNSQPVYPGEVHSFAFLCLASVGVGLISVVMGTFPSLETPPSLFAFLGAADSLTFTPVLAILVEYNQNVPMLHQQALRSPFWWLCLGIPC